MISVDTVVVIVELTALIYLLQYDIPAYLFQYFFPNPTDKKASNLVLQ